MDNVILAVNHEGIENYIKNLENINVVRILNSNKNLLNECEKENPEIVVISHMLPGLEITIKELIEKLSVSKTFNGRIIYLYGDEDSETKNYISWLISKGIYDYHSGDLNQNIIKELLFKAKTRNDVKKDIIKSDEEFIITQNNDNINVSKNTETIVTKNIIIEKEVKKIMYPIVISVCGTRKGAGSTHQSLALAQFLRSQNFKVAVMECNESGDLKELFYEGLEGSLKDSFTIDNIDFYTNNSQSILDVMNSNYQYIILDFGCIIDAGEKEKEEIKRSHLKVLVSSIKDWNMRDIEKVIQEYPIHWKMLAVFSNEKMFSEFENLIEGLNIDSFLVPYFPDPTKLNDDVENLFNILLKEYLAEVKNEVIKRRGWFSKK